MSDARWAGVVSVGVEHRVIKNAVPKNCFGVIIRVDYAGSAVKIAILYVKIMFPVGTPGPHCGGRTPSTLVPISYQVHKQRIGIAEISPVDRTIPDNAVNCAGTV